MERDRPLFEGLNSNSDSELSMPESSQFESMEGIESGSEVTGAGGIAGIDRFIAAVRSMSQGTAGGSSKLHLDYGRPNKGWGIASFFGW